MRIGASARATVRLYGSDALSSINESPAAIGPLPATGFVDAGPATFVPSVNDPDNVRASNFVSTLVLFEQRASSAFGYTVSFHRLGTDRVFRDGPLGVSAFEPVTPTSSRFKATVDTLDARADREWSTRQTTRVAYEFERERYVSESFPVNHALAWNAENGVPQRLSFPGVRPFVRSPARIAISESNALSNRPPAHEVSYRPPSEHQRHSARDYRAEPLTPARSNTSLSGKWINFRAARPLATLELPPHLLSRLRHSSGAPSTSRGGPDRRYRSGFRDPRV